MVINKKILLHSLLVGLVFMATFSYSTSDDRRILQRMLPLIYTGQGGLWTIQGSHANVQFAAQEFCSYQQLKIEMLKTLPTSPKGSPLYRFKHTAIRQAKRQRQRAQRILQGLERVAPTAPSIATEDQTPASE